MELVDQLRLTIPEEIRSAEDVLSQKDQILNTAANDARRTKSMAEDELRDRLNSNELVTQAETRAAETVRRSCLQIPDNHRRAVSLSSRKTRQVVLRTHTR